MQARVLRYTRRVAVAVWVLVGVLYAVAPGVEVSAAQGTTCADVGCDGCVPGNCLACAQIGQAICLKSAPNQQ